MAFMNHPDTKGHARTVKPWRHGMHAIARKSYLFAFHVLARSRDWCTARCTTFSRFAVSALASLMLLVGCASPRNDPIANGSILVEKQPNTAGYYRDIRADHREGVLHVSGYVRRSYPPGEITVQLLTHDGSLITEASAPVRRVPRSSRVRHAHFETRLVAPPPQSAVVRLTHRRTEGG